MTYSNSADDLSTRYHLFDGLNEHGFLFEEKCTDVLAENSGETRWSIQARQFPVTINNRDLHIDIVLKDNSNPELQVYAIVECKRIDPLLSHWLFGNPTEVHEYKPRYITLSSHHDHQGNYKTFYTLQQFPCSQAITYIVDNWWLEQRSQEKRRITSPLPVEDVFMQTAMGIYGLSREIEVQWRKLFVKQSIIFIPIVLTSAPLFIANYKVEDVDIVSGDISPDKVTFGPLGEKPQQIKWLLVNYSTSRSISPDSLFDTAKGYSPSELEEYYKRAIFVVNSEHIVEFFSKLHQD